MKTSIFSLSKSNRRNIINNDKHINQLDFIKSSSISTSDIDDVSNYELRINQDGININDSTYSRPSSIIHGDEERVRRAMLTTSDNPFNPFKEFDLWFAFDSLNNYNSCSYLARIAKTSDDLSEIDNELAIEQAVNEIVELNINGLYVKVVNEV